MKSKDMGYSRWPMVLALGIAVSGTLMGGCSSDPNTKKENYFQSGMQYFQAEKYHEAAIQYQNALQLDPRYVDAHYQLGLCYVKLKIWNGAYNELERTVELDPHDWKARIDLGDLLLAAGQDTNAEEQAKAVLAALPDSVEAHTLMAGIYAQQKDLQASEAELKNAIRLDPKRSQSYLALGGVQASAKETAAAEASFQKAIELDPKSAGPVISLGSFYFQQGRMKEAEEQFRKATELEPKAPAPRAALARILLAQGQGSQAEQVLAQAKKDLSDNSDGYRLLGDFYFDAGEMDKALAEYASLYLQHPKDMRVKKNYIQLLILQDRLDEAEKLDGEILKENPKESEAEVLRSQILIHRGRPADALPLLQSAVKGDPQDAVGHYYLGVAFNLTGDIGEAEKEWREAVKLRPNLVDAHQALADLAVRRGDKDLLRQSAGAIITAKPSSPDGYLWRARGEFAGKDERGAEADLHKVIELAPGSPLGYAALGDLRTTQGKFSEAGHLFEQALDHDPNYTPALNGLASLALRHGGPTEALRRVQEQINKAPSNSSYYYLLGALLGKLEQWDKSRAALEKALSLDKNNTDALILLGQVESAQGSLEKAIEDNEKAIQQNAHDIRAYILLGSLEEKTGNWQKAEQVYQQALQVQPDYPLAANNLAYLMLEHGGNTDAALSLAQIARRGLPDMPGSADTLAWAYYQKGAYRLAVDLLDEAARKNPNNPTFQYHLGMSFAKTGDRTRAKEHLERALQLDPNFASAPEIRKELADLDIVQ